MSTHAFALGFYDGFWYPVRPFYNVQNYFTYPVFQWFFVNEAVSPQYYTNYYAALPTSVSPSAVPSASTPPPSSCLGTFPYKNIYFPTDTLRDLLVEVSGFPQELRCNFRVAIIDVTAQFKKDVSSYFAIPFEFHPDDIVVNYYQNLQNKAIIMAGFVNQGKINMAFEALLDLQNPDNSITFAPDGQTPNDQ